MTRHTHPLAHPDDPHFISRAGWLRAAVLGANDGIVSVASLLLGVAAAGTSHEGIILAGVAGLAAGALSMAAGEYVSVSSQADVEHADMHREKAALETAPDIELEELTTIYIKRGLTPETARIVAEEMHDHDPLGAHLRDELGLSEIHSARPLQAAFASAVTFSVAAALPLLGAMFSPLEVLIPVVLLVTVMALALLGAVGAIAGGAPILRAVMRVLVWGIAAMAITAWIGHLFA